MPERVTIEEIGVPSPLRLVLEDADLPFAEEMGSEAFSSGGKVIKERIDLPGNLKPIFHMLVAPERPLVIEGAWRDWQWAQTGHARSQKALCERIRKRANELKIVVYGEEYTGILDETKYGEESERSITYELTFEILTAPNQADVRTTETAAPVDQATTLGEVLKARRENVAKLPLNKTVQQQLQTYMNTAYTALGNVQREVTSLNKVVGNVTSQVRRVMGVARAAQNAVMAAQSAFRTLQLERDMVRRDASNTAAFWQQQFGADVEFTDALAGLQAIRRETRKRQIKSTRLYRVRSGDTLELIAQRMLGNVGRVNDLGVRADQIVPGALIRIPIN